VIDVTCPLCGEVYHADPAHVGKRIKCGRCSPPVPILGADGTIVERTPNARVVGESPPRADYREPRPSQRRFAVRLGIAIVVAVFATSLHSAAAFRHACRNRTATQRKRGRGSDLIADGNIDTRTISHSGWFHGDP